MNYLITSEHTIADEVDVLSGKEPSIHQNAEIIDNMSFGEEVSGYECFFCDKVFDAFERLEEHQEYHLIETECDEVQKSALENSSIVNFYCFKVQSSSRV